MSYNPEPDFEKEFPRHAALRKRFIAFATKRPIALAFRIWLVCALFSAFMLWIGGPEAFNRPTAKLILFWGMLGWAVPFADWIRVKKAKDE
jgi:hypothetical protein